MAFQTPDFIEFTDLFSWANDLTGMEQMWGIMFIITLWMIGFLSLKGAGFPTEQAFASSTFVLMIISILLIYANVITTLVFLPLIGMAVLSIFMMMRQGQT